MSVTMIPWEKRRAFPEWTARQNSIQAAFQHNSVYAVGVSDQDRVEFRRALDQLLRSQNARYRQRVEERAHMDAIRDISESLSRKYSGVLAGGVFRIGTCQKALNLYLKFLWCLEPEWPVPPHCPIDRQILRAAGLSGEWTTMNSLTTYKEWTDGLRRHAASRGYSSLAEWELDAWKPV